MQEWNKKIICIEEIGKLKKLAYFLFKKVLLKYL